MMEGEFDIRSFQISSNHNPNNGFEHNLHTSISNSTNSDSAYNGDFSQSIMKFINDMLMEEDLEDKPCMLQDCLALQAAEKSFYDVLGEKYPPESDQSSCSFNKNDQNSDDSLAQISCLDSCNSYINWNFDQGETESAHILHGAISNANSSLPFVNFDLPSDPSKQPDSTRRRSPDGRNFLYNRKSGKKNQPHENDDHFEKKARSKKQPAVILSEELEQLAIFDNSFLHKVEKNESLPCPLFDASRNKASKKLQKEEQLLVTNARTMRLAKNTGTVNLPMVVISCAQATGTGDQKTAYEQLKLIRQHSSPYGDANQRLAHYFANALEARLAGFGVQSPLIGPATNAADILRAYQNYVSICPFRTMSNFFGNRTIAKVVEKETCIHIIDFGIGYGFQWPCFISRLSKRPGGPPRIRITGIDFPQPGFRPAERVEETGRRLKRLADKFNVPFEYNAIAQKWETIRYEDFKLEKDEIVAVCCMIRLKNLPDDTVVLNSPRDSVLQLIKRINPAIFLHGVANGSYNAPFFTTRFREAFFHYSALFDMFETITTREDQERLVYEREFYGKDIMNVVASEGLERYERPETYKQWHMRNRRIGFRQEPLHQDIMKAIRNIKNDYHKEFTLDEDGHWILMGWKGKTFHAISAWKPVE